MHELTTALIFLVICIGVSYKMIKYAINDFNKPENVEWRKAWRKRMNEQSKEIARKKKII